MQVTTLKPNTEILEPDFPVMLQSGEVIPNVKITYTTIGEMNEDKSNIIWVFHALTANSNPLDWWTGLFQNGTPLDPEKHFIICANILGSCYGTTGPEDKNFPFITIRDIVSLHQILRDHLDIKKVKLGIGGSMGGQQLLEWAVQENDFFEKIVPIATNAAHSPWGIAFNEAQRMALENIDKGKGLEAARAIAMLSYRNYKTYHQSQKDEDQRWDAFSASSYQRYQGEKLRLRFDTHTYYYLSKAMDSHNVGRNGLSISESLSRIRSKALIIGLDTDILFPVQEQKEIAQHIPGANFRSINSDYGHDGFLIETEKLNDILKAFINE